jgi:hypothetical protein
MYAYPIGGEKRRMGNEFQSLAGAVSIMQMCNVLSRVYFTLPRSIVRTLLDRRTLLQQRVDRTVV